MTVITESNKIRQNGDGIVAAFDFSFPVLSAAELIIAKPDTDEDDAEVTPLTLNVDYTVSLNTVAPGGTVTYTIAPTDAQDSFIKRNTTPTQATDIPRESNFPEETIEKALDKNVMLIQDIEERVARAIKLADTSTGEIVFPAPIAEKYLYALSTTVLEWVGATDASTYPGTIGAGLLSARPTSPTVNDFYLAIDTGQIYYCASVGVWSEYATPNSPYKEMKIEGIKQDNYGGGTQAVAASKWLEQSVTPDVDMYVDSISLRFQSVAAATIKVRVETDNNGEPSGSLATGFSEVDITGTGTPVRKYSLGFTGKLEAETRYWIRVSCVAIGPNTYYYADDNIMSGEKWRYDGGSWNNNDMYLEIGTTDLVEGEAVRSDSGAFAKAQADSEANSNVFVGFVQNVSAVSFRTTSTIALPASIIDEGISGLTAGSLYYLSPSVAGAITTTKPTTNGQVVKPVLVALSTTSGLILGETGIVVKDEMPLLTIATGEIDVLGYSASIDTEGGGATDDLDTINGGEKGKIYVFQAADDTHDVVFKDGTGNLILAGGDVTLDHGDDTITLFFDGTNFILVATSDNS